MKYNSQVKMLKTLFSKLFSCTAKNNHTAYDFSFQNANGEPFNLSSLQGQVILIVNTASKCFFTKQFTELEALYRKFHKQGFIIIGVPSNDFGHQEPHSNEQIQQFCDLNFKVTFPIVRKEIIKGAQAHPFYAWAKSTLGFGTAPKWNFHKYLINRDGQLVDYFHTFTSPDSPRVIKAIEQLLAESSKVKVK